jgi:hypothetical protein
VVEHWSSFSRSSHSAVVKSRISPCEMVLPETTSPRRQSSLALEARGHQGVVIKRAGFRCRRSRGTRFVSGDQRYRWPPQKGEPVEGGSGRPLFAVTNALSARPAERGRSERRYGLCHDEHSGHFNRGYVRRSGIRPGVSPGPAGIKQSPGWGGLLRCRHGRPGQEPHAAARGATGGGGS